MWLSHRLAGLLSHSREAFRRLVIGPAEVGCDFVKQYLDDLVRQGKVLYVGISDAPAWWIAQANTLAHLRGWSAFIGLQIEYSLISEPSSGN